MIEDREAFSVRCSARQRERQLGTGYGFGVFVDGEFAGEINLSSIQRGPFQSAVRGLLDRRGRGRPRLHARGAWWCWPASPSRSCACTASRSSIIPRNRPAAGWWRSWRSATRASAVRYLEINGTWEDHVRYAITSEEWQERRDELWTAWID